MIIDLTLPELEETDSYSDYCHICCTCSPLITLCGGFKPVECGVYLLDTTHMQSCPKCSKPFCPDCNIEMPNDCPRCGQ